MMFTVSPWVVWPVAALALTGLGAVCYTAWEAAAGAWAWWQDRGEDEKPDPWPDELGTLVELAPERSQEELGFTRPQPARERSPVMQEDWPEARQAAFIIGDLGAHRERRAPWWEAEHRAAYESLGFDYPSGLLARVREAGQRSLAPLTTIVHHSERMSLA